MNIAFVQPETFFGSGFPIEKMSHAYVTESGPTYATGPQTRGKRIVEFSPMSTGDFSGTTPANLIEYTGNGKATANGLAAGPDGLYFTDLYKDQNPASPIEPGANILRVRYGNPPPGHVRPKSATPVKVPLVPSFRSATRRTAPTARRWRTARAQPPSQSSDYLTVGTPDANAKTANSIGSVKLSAIAGQRRDVGGRGRRQDQGQRSRTSARRATSPTTRVELQARLRPATSPTRTTGPTLGDSATIVCRRDALHGALRRDGVHLGRVHVLFDDHRRCGGARDRAGGQAGGLGARA